MPTGPRTVLFNRDHVVTVVLSDNEASRDPGYTVATRRTVSMRLSTGEQITGAVCVYRPEGRDRLSDWARQSEVFRYVETDDKTIIVNSAHIVEIIGGERHERRRADRPAVPRDVRGGRVGPASVRRLAADDPQGRPHAAARRRGGRR